MLLVRFWSQRLLHAHSDLYTFCKIKVEHREMDPRDFCSFFESHGFVAGGEDNCSQEYILFAFCHDIDVNVPECVGLFF